MNDDFDLDDFNKMVELDFLEVMDIEDDEEFEQAIMNLKKKIKKYYWNNSIQTKDKNNSINIERRKFSPTSIMKVDKRIGVNKRRHYIDDPNFFNDFNN